MNLNKRTVELQLQWLRGVGLAEQRSGRYIAITDREKAEQVATMRGTLGIRQAIKERHERERKAFHLARLLRQRAWQAKREQKQAGTPRPISDQGSNAMLM